MPGAAVYRLHLWRAVYLSLQRRLYLRSAGGGDAAAGVAVSAEAAGSAAGGGAGAVYRGHGAHDPQRGAAPGAGRYHLPAMRRSLRRGSGADGPGGPRSAGQRPAAGHFAAGGGGLRDAGAVLPTGEALPATDPCRVGSGPVSGGVLLRRGLRHPDGAAAVHLRQPCGADLHAGAGVLCHRGVFLCP